MGAGAGETGWGEPEVKLHQCSLEALNQTKLINPNERPVYELYYCLEAKHEQQRHSIQARFHYTQALQHVATRTDSDSVLRRMIALCRFGDTYEAEDRAKLVAHYLHAWVGAGF